MRSFLSFLNTKVSPPNAWVMSALCASFLIIGLLGFSEISALIARGTVEEPIRPVRFWVASGLVVLLFIWFLSWTLAQWVSVFRKPKR